jgi:hypothetical protein
MLKKSLIFGSIAVLAALLLITGCSNPTSGPAPSENEETPSGPNGPSGPGGTIDNSKEDFIYDSAVTDTELAGKFAKYSTVYLGTGVTSVTGTIPAGKTLVVAVSPVVVKPGESLNVLGSLEINSGQVLNASYNDAAGHLTGSGPINGQGTVTLPYLKGTTLPDVIDLAKAKGSAKKAVGSIITSGGTAAVTKDNIDELFEALEEAFPDSNIELSVADIAELTNTWAQEGRTLVLAGNSNTINAVLDLSGNDGALIVNGTLAATVAGTAIKANPTKSNVTINGTLDLLGNAGGTIEGLVTNNGTIKSKATTAAIIQKLITEVAMTPGTTTGKVELTGEGAAIATAMTLTQNVSIGTGGKLTVSTAPKPFAGGKTITITGTGVLDLGAAANDLSGVTIVNGGTGGIATATTSAAFLQTVLNQRGVITSSGAVAGNVAITIPEDTDYTHAGDSATFAGGGGALTIKGKATFTKGAFGTQTAAVTIDEGAEALFSEAVFTTLAADLTVNGKATLTLVGVPAGDVVVGSTGDLILTAGLTLKEGKILDNAGKVTLVADGVLTLTTGDSEADAITGAGKIIAGKTELTGAWQTVASDADTLTITASANGAAIEKGTTDGTLIAVGGATITQSAGDANAFTVDEDTIVDLTAGRLVLTAADSDGGSTAGTGTIKAGKTEIVGIWEATGTTGTITITGGTNGATIVPTTPATTLTGGTGGAITQTAGTNNNLTLTGVTVDLSTDGSIVLKAAASAQGQITLSNASTVIYCGDGENEASSPLSIDEQDITVGGSLVITRGEADGYELGSITGPGTLAASGTTPTDNDVTIAKELAVAASGD